jgi:glutamate/tyrosine decarboxylase-like PLP-dependent enzyme
MREMIAADRASGIRPICIVGNAGTVNTGAVDDLPALADLASREGTWFHVDGAFGALACLSPRLKPALAGMERADSLTFDFHKWLYLPYEIGVVLVRDEEAHRRTFSLTPDYLAHGARGLNAGLWFSDYGVQLSRGFRALKAWMHIREHGADKLGRLIDQNVAQARHLARLMAPVPLNIVCFRYRADRTDAELDALNQELLVRLQESGVAAPSYTRIGGRYALRAAITNHRSRREDFDAMVAEVLRIGRELAALPR